MLAYVYALKKEKKKDLERFSAFVCLLLVHLVKGWIAFQLSADKSAHNHAVFATFPPTLKKQQITGAHILLRRDIMSSISRSGGRYLHLFACRAVKRERRNRSLSVFADSTLPYGANVNEVAAGQTDCSATLPKWLLSPSTTRPFRSASPRFSASYTLIYGTLSFSIISCVLCSTHTYIQWTSKGTTN